VYVPCGSLANYKKSEEWHSFTNIIENYSGEQEQFNA
jgi:hypothetical protein